MSGHGWPGRSATDQIGTADRCAQNGLAEEALEYAMAAADADMAAGLVEKLWHPTYQQGRSPRFSGGSGGLNDQGGIEGHPLAAVFAALTADATGRPAAADRWATWSIAGSPSTRPGLPARPPPGPPCSGLGCAAAGSS